MGDNIKMDIKEMGQDACLTVVVTPCEHEINLRGVQNVGNLLTI